MQEKTYLRLVASHFSGLSSQEESEILAYLRLFFEEGRQAGKTEEEISEALGSPSTFMETYYAARSHNLDQEPDESPDPEINIDLDSYVQEWVPAEGDPATEDENGGCGCGCGCLGTILVVLFIIFLLLFLAA